MSRVAVVLAAALAPTAALAEPTHSVAATEEARALHARGSQRYQAGDYAGAAALFLEAHQRQSRPELLFNAAQAFRRANVCDRAATLYRDFLIAAPRAAGRQVIERHIATMDECVARRSATAMIDEPPPPPSWRSTAGWVSTSTGFLLVSAAGLLAWDSRQASGHVSETFREGRPWTEADAELARRGARSERLAWIAGGAGASAMAAGAYLLFFGERETNSSPRVSFDDRGAVAGWSWMF